MSNRPDRRLNGRKLDELRKSSETARWANHRANNKTYEQWQAEQA